VLRLHHGPLVHGTRPAIDPLLHSGAYVCGNRVTAVVLSGPLRDGASGTATVSAAGGNVLIQDPADARSPAMPRAALDQVPGAGVWPAAKLGRAVAEQVAAPAPSTIAPEFRPSCAEGVGDPLVSGVGLPIVAVGVDLEQDGDAVPGAAGDLGSGYPEFSQSETAAWRRS
jgi:two-component system chemotaxis response regulator CheB